MIVTDYAKHEVFCAFLESIAGSETARTFRQHLEQQTSKLDNTPAFDANSPNVLLV